MNKSWRLNNLRDHKSLCFRTIEKRLHCHMRTWLESQGKQNSEEGLSHQYKKVDRSQILTHVRCHMDDARVAVETGVDGV